MQLRFLVSLFISFGLLFCSCLSFARSSVEPVQSTQGVENIEQNLDKSKPPAEQKNEQKNSKNRLNKYLKTKKKIKKQDFKRSVKQKELEFLEKRLDQKKKKLETLTSEVEKGESK